MTKENAIELKKSLDHIEEIAGIIQQGVDAFDGYVSHFIIITGPSMIFANVLCLATAIAYADDINAYNKFGISQVSCLIDDDSFYIKIN